MKTLQKYFFKEFIIHFLPIAIFFISIFAISEFFWRLNDFITYKPSITIIIYFLSLHLPLWFVQTLPLSIMFSTVLSISNFNYTKELVAIKTLGINTKKFFLSWLIIGLVLSITSFFINEKIATKFFYKAQEIFYTKIKKEQFDENNLTNLFYYSHQQDISTYIFIDRYDITNTKIYSFLLQEYQNGKIKTQVYSNEGKKNNLMLDLFDTVQQQFYNNRIISEKHVKNYKYQLPVDIENFKYNFATMQLDQLNINQLKQAIKICKFKGEPVNRIVNEISFRYAISFLNFILIFISISLGQTSLSQHNKLNSLIYVILSFIIYWTMLSFLRTLGETGIVNPYISVWIPNIIFFFAGFVLYINRYL
jgi:lipopolysaccharide export system permease protein